MRFIREVVIGSVLGVMASGSALAGGHSGNGGNAVVCSSPSGEIQSVAMFDYWERDQASPVPGGTQLGGPSLSLRQKIDVFADRVLRFDEERAERIRKQAYEIVDHLDAYLVDGIDLPTIDDDHPRAVPQAPCRKVQFAVQVSVPVPGKRRFQIHRELFLSPQTSSDARVGLILHEVIYREAIALGQTNSDLIRRYNALIAADAIREGDFSGYERLLKETRFAYQGCRAVQLPNLNGQVIYYYERPAVLPPGETLQTICRESALVYRGIRISLVKGDYIHLSSDGNFAAVGSGRFELPWGGRIHELKGGFRFGDESSLQVWYARKQSPFQMRFQGQKLDCRNSVEVAFYGTAEARITACGFGGERMISIQGKKIKIMGSLSIHPNGSLAKTMIWYTQGSGWFSKGMPALSFEGVARPMKFHGQVSFNPTGEVISGQLAEPQNAEYLGRPLVVYGLDREDGKTFAANGHGVVPAIHQGLRILAPHGYTDEIKGVLDEGCRKAGYSGLHTLITAERIKVRAYEEFYDPVTRSRVAKFDEEAVILPSVSCWTRTPVQL